MTEAAVDAQVRTQLQALLHTLDAALRTRIAHAQQAGELPASADPEALAITASAFLHTLAIRSRAGVARKKLELVIETAIAQICDAPAGSKARGKAARSR